MVETTNKPGVKLNTQPVKPLIDVTFWTSFTKLKLDVWKVSRPSVEIEGKVSLPVSANAISDLVFDQESFSNYDPENFPRKQVIGGLINSLVPGTLLHCNTIEEFQALDQLSNLQDLPQTEVLKPCNELQQLIEQQRSKLTPDCPNRFVLCIFGDLKKYIYKLKFAMLHYDHQGYVTQTLADRVLAVLKQDKTNEMAGKIWDHLSKSQSNLEPSFFKIDDYLCFLDPSSKLPSSMLVNKLVMNSDEVKSQDVILIREKLSKLSGKMTLNSSILLRVVYGDNKPAESCFKLQPLLWINRSVELSQMMDPGALASQAVNLNLKLMKWRQQPELNLDILQKTSCLLLGSGSLGCQVARNLLAWGFTSKITFVDNGRVSYSNPVRQCLFTFEDSQGQDNYKAPIAAKRLMEIYPSVNAEGVVLSIPMPGHSVGDDPKMKAQIENDAQKLEELVKAHDVVFLLLDSREARWLPTVMAIAHEKLCLTIGLGFDTFLVMRHGLSHKQHQTLNQERLGCYFCNDIVAPRNSTQDRTLDQQCTVSRPALCTMASALGVELLVSILNHPLGNAAKANDEYLDCDRSCLGILPQQIRGDLNTFETKCMYGLSYERCTGCSQHVQDGFEKEEDFLLKVCNMPNYLEDLTGLTQMNMEINMDDIESIDSDDFAMD